MTGLLGAALYGNLKKVKELLNRGANIHARSGSGLQAIHMASEGHLPIVKELINRGANVHARDKRGNQPIHLTGRLPVVKELLNQGANINARDNTGRQPIYYAAQKGLLPFVKFLLNKGASANNVLKSNAVGANMKNAIKKYIENRNVTRALIINSMAKGPKNNTKPFGFPNRFPINALVKSLRRK